MNSIIKKIKTIWNNFNKQKERKMLPPSNELSNEKEEFFKLYNKIKNKEISMETLSERQLKQVIEMLEIECNMTEDNIQSFDKKIEDNRKKTMYYKEMTRKKLENL